MIGLTLTVFIMNRNRELVVEVMSKSGSRCYKLLKMSTDVYKKRSCEPIWRRCKFFEEWFLNIGPSVVLSRPSTSLLERSGLEHMQKFSPAHRAACQVIDMIVHSDINLDMLYPKKESLATTVDYPRSYGLTTAVLSGNGAAWP